MRVGAVFPQTEIGGDAGAIRAYGEGVEALGFTHLTAYDHVVGADPAVHTGWSGPYDVRSTFHEPLVTFGYLAAVTTTIELVSSVLVLPQRQATLVAKQAAEVDILSGGRLRLGVGVGWNQVEYEALGADFTTRGKRFEDQIALLRQLWTESTVTHRDAFHTVTGAGLAPLPVQRPIPIWIGGASPVAFRRAGRLADGWFPMVVPGPGLDRALAAVHDGAVSAGRDPADIDMEGHVTWRGDEAEFAEHLSRWDAAGATHVAVNTMGRGFTSVDDHLGALGRAVEVARTVARTSVHGA